MLLTPGCERFWLQRSSRKKEGLGAGGVGAWLPVRHISGTKSDDVSPTTSAANCFPGKKMQLTVMQHSFFLFFFFFYYLLGFLGFSPPAPRWAVGFQLWGSWVWSKKSGIFWPDTSRSYSTSKPTCGCIATIHSLLFHFLSFFLDFFLITHGAHSHTVQSQLWVDKIALFEKSGCRGETLMWENPDPIVDQD